MNTQDPAAVAELAYERHLERQADSFAEADLRSHEAAWPNGYGRCGKDACGLEVYHDGDCRNTLRVDASELRWAPGVWLREVSYQGVTAQAVSRHAVAGQLQYVRYANADWDVIVYND